MAHLPKQLGKLHVLCQPALHREQLPPNGGLFVEATLGSIGLGQQPHVRVVSRRLRDSLFQRPGGAVQVAHRQTDRAPPNRNLCGQAIPPLAACGRRHRHIHCIEQGQALRPRAHGLRQSGFGDAQLLLSIGA